MNRIREYRKQKKLTLKQLSEELAKRDLKISPDALGKYERGDREPKLETWVKLGDFFDVPYPYLAGAGEKLSNSSKHDDDTYIFAQDLNQVKDLATRNLQEKYPHTNLASDKLSAEQKTVLDGQIGMYIYAIDNLAGFSQFDSIAVITNLMRVYGRIIDKYFEGSIDEQVFNQRLDYLDDDIKSVISKHDPSIYGKAQSNDEEN